MKDKTEAKFVHDCESCDFLGHFFGHDVYLHAYTSREPSIIARFGSDGPEYYSMPISLFSRQLMENQPIVYTGYEDNRLVETRMPFQEYLFGPKGAAFHRAMLMGVVHLGFGLACDEPPTLETVI